MLYISSTYRKQKKNSKREKFKSERVKQRVLSFAISI